MYYVVWRIAHYNILPFQLKMSSLSRNVTVHICITQKWFLTWCLDLPWFLQITYYSWCLYFTKFLICQYKNSRQLYIHILKIRHVFGPLFSWGFDFVIAYHSRIIAKIKHFKIFSGLKYYVKPCWQIFGPWQLTFYESIFLLILTCVYS